MGEQRSGIVNDDSTSAQRPTIPREWIFCIGKKSTVCTRKKSGTSVARDFREAKTTESVSTVNRGAHIDSAFNKLYLKEIQ
jgi:hypothetical protein